MDSEQTTESETVRVAGRRLRLLPWITSGTAMGLLLNVSEFTLNAIWLNDAWTNSRRSLGLGALTGGAAAIMSASTVVLAWVSVGAHVASPPGIWRALRSATLVWLLAYVIGFGWSCALGLVPITIYLVTLPVALAELCLGLLVGDWIYYAMAPKTDRSPSRTHAT